MFKEKQKLRVTITGISFGGYGITRVDNFVLFVPFSCPGDELEVEVEILKKRYGFAKIKSILKKSELRVDPPCSSYEECGGCQLQHINYKKQLEYKEQIVKETFKKIAKMDELPFQSILYGEKSFNYRNKAIFHVKKSLLGFYKRGSNEIIELDECKIIDQSINDNIKYLKNLNLEISKILVRSASSTSESLICLFGQKQSKIADETLKNFTSVYYNFLEKDSFKSFGSIFKLISGKGSITEKIKDLKFKVTPSSFLQVNTNFCELVYDEMLKIADLKGHENILDLYCGVGTISLLFAKHCTQVIGIESNRESVKLANDNKAINEIKNTEFIVGKAEKMIRKILSRKLKPDMVILDPSRSGVYKSLLLELANLKIPKIIYLSCSVATMARDIKILSSKGYKLEYLRPLDMFPQTYHIECLGLLTI